MSVWTHRLQQPQLGRETGLAGVDQQSRVGLAALGEVQAEHEGGEGQAVDLEAHRLGHLEVLDESLPVVALEENIPDSSEEDPRDISMHLINFLDFIEYNFSTLVLMVAVKVLLVPRIGRTIPLALLYIHLVDPAEKEVILRV